MTVVNCWLTATSNWSYGMDWCMESMVEMSSYCIQGVGQHKSMKFWKLQSRRRDWMVWSKTVSFIFQTAFMMFFFMRYGAYSITSELGIRSMCIYRLLLILLILLISFCWSISFLLKDSTLTRALRMPNPLDLYSLEGGRQAMGPTLTPLKPIFFNPQSRTPFQSNPLSMRVLLRGAQGAIAPYRMRVNSVAWVAEGMYLSTCVKRKQRAGDQRGSGEYCVMQRLPTTRDRPKAFRVFTSIIKINIRIMQLQEVELRREQGQLSVLNEQLSLRAAKYGSQFVPLSMGEYKMFKVRKASETGNIQYLDTILLSQIQDLQQRKQAIQHRLHAFYPAVQVQQGDSISLSYKEFFGEKHLPDFSEDSTVLRPQAWYLFGVDYMDNQRIREYFGGGVMRVEWLNDSACNVVFGSREEGEEAVAKRRKGGQMLSENEIWHEMEEYVVDNVRRKLYSRQATNKDVKREEINGRDSEYYKWVRNKKKLGNHVRKVAREQIHKNKMISRDFLMKQRIEKFQTMGKGGDVEEQEMK